MWARWSRLCSIPTAAPKTTAVRPEVGYKVGHQSEYGGFEVREVDRRQYYRSVHPQTVAVRDRRGRGAGACPLARPPARGHGAGRPGRLLFPQVLRIVREYLRDRVDLNGMAPEEVGLEIYQQRIVGLLSAAIRPDDAVGEPPELPRLNRYRPSGSTASVYFKTVKPVVAATASHVNFVACDTDRWEQAAAGQLEQLAGAGVVSSFVRNERLEFVIPYSFQGNERGYEPDFIVSLTNGVRLIVEIKGMEPPETPAKHEAAKRWVRAVNQWRRMGEWDFLVCRNPAQLGVQIGDRVAERKKRTRAIAERLLAESFEETERLRKQGWTREDFARSLINLLEHE